MQGRGAAAFGAYHAAAGRPNGPTSSCTFWPHRSWIRSPPARTTARRGRTCSLVSTAPRSRVQTARRNGLGAGHTPWSASVARRSAK